MRSLLLSGIVAVVLAGQWLGAADAAAQTAGRQGKATAPAPSAAAQADADDHDASVPGETGSITKAPPAAGWSEADIATAKERCQALLKDLDAVVIPVEPIKDGSCGAPAPVQLISIGKSPQVSLSPPPVVTCEMVGALAQWLANDVQPAARQLLRGSVIRLEVMSDYSCRNAYARRMARLSEHGRANALDIAQFITERGEVTELRADWGETDRGMRVRVAAAEKAAKEAAEKAEKIKAAAIAAASKEGLRGSTAEKEVLISKEETRPTGIFSLQGAGQASAMPTLSLTPPSRLGGPRAPATEAPALSSKQKFLRRIHTSACRHFGTVLGPEANDAHNNHFHLDMAERKTGNFCR